MLHPLISFIIPFYGSVRLLERCLDSIAAQTDGDFEAIVVDDQSPESAVDLVARYDARFRYVLQPENSGPYQGRVRGIDEARGDYIVDVDCDDYVMPELVAEIRKTAADGADLIINNVEQDWDGNICPHWCRYPAGRYTPMEVMDRLVRRELQWNFWSKAIRRSVVLSTWESAPALRTTRVMAPDDYCATVPMILASRRIDVIPYVGYRYWQNPDSICHGVSFAKAWKAITDTLEARRLVLTFAERCGASSAVRGHIRRIARMIVWWWTKECLADFKRKVKRLLRGREGRP